MEKLIRQEAEKIAKELGYDIWDIKIFKGKRCLIKIFIDKKERIKLEDCEKFTRLIKSVIEIKEIVKGPYILEVSSPGIERELRAIEHFKKSLGKKIKIKTKKSIKNKYVFQGSIIDVDDYSIKLRENQEEVSINLEEIKKAHAVL